MVKVIFFTSDSKSDKILIVNIIIGILIMTEGIVKWFDKKRGYGFVEQEGKDIFIHHTEIVGKFIPENNETISFDIVNGEKGLKAINITKAG